MKICFIDNGKAYKPELHAYRAYFASKGFAVETVEDPRQVDADAVAWSFTGLDPAWNPAPGLAAVHDYATLSVPPFVGVKNWAKRLLNRRPSLRIFLNATVEKAFGFTDAVPCVHRDMGVNKLFFSSALPQGTKNYDFLYIGSVTRQRRVDEAFDWILRHRLGRILVIGEPDDHVFGRLGHCPEISFAGRIPYGEIPGLAAQARYGLNWVPDVYPFNRQTSTKLLEYCALGLPILSNRYAWVEAFASARAGRFLFFRPDQAISRKDIDNFRFVTPKVDDLEWERLLAEVGEVGLAQTLKNLVESR